MHSQRHSWDESGDQRSDTPCYTCRRRRVICDKALPTCRKCQAAGKQCLGYKKPLTWVQGVASRGKMMGLTFDDVTKKQDQEQEGCSRSMWVDGLCDLKSCSPSQHSNFLAVHETRSAQSSPRSEGIATPGTPSMVPDDGSSTVSWSSRSSPCEGREAYLLPGNQSCIRPALVDPIFHGISNIERHYLSYYDKRVCKLMVLFEVPDGNPYRQLIPMGKTSPTLRSSIAAVAACHYMHTFNRNSIYSYSFDGRGFVAPRTSLSFNEELAKSPNPIVRSTYRHVLLFKQQALSRLKDNLSNPQTQDRDTTIASIVLLILLDLLESGHGDWKIHMDGAKELIKTRLGDLAHTVGNDDESSLLPTLYDKFDAFLTSTCMTLDIMGSTLAKSGTWCEPIYLQLMNSPALFSQAEQTMFTGCPGYLLCIILFITSLRHCGPDQLPSFFPNSFTTTTPEANLPSILDYIEKFDSVAWALEMESLMAPKSTYAPSSIPLLPPSPNDSPSHESFSSPYHLAFAYKIAITLYATRVLKHPSPQEANFESAVTSLLSHLSQIPTTSELFKCTVWPVFIAGTECQDPEQRAWIQNWLQKLWDEYLSVNTRAAGRVLEVIWNRNNISRCLGAEEEGDWIQYLDRSTFNWLFV